jgi:predicted secreted protein
MSLPSILVIFVLSWWAVFFAVLPMGVKSQKEVGEIVPGTDPGAPHKSQLRWKLAVTTGVSLLISGVFYFAASSDFLSIENIAKLFG